MRPEPRDAPPDGDADDRALADLIDLLGRLAAREHLRRLGETRRPDPADPAAARPHSDEDT